MSYKKILILVMFMLFGFFQTNVQASSNYVRVCKYKNLQTKEDVFLHWDQNFVKLRVGNDEPKVIVYDSDDYNILDGIDRVFAAGCPKYMNYSSFWKSYSFDDKPDNSKEVFEFKGVINEGKDIYRSESYEKEGTAHVNMTCKYKIANGETITVSVNEQGKITNNKEAKITNPYDFMNVIDNKFRCPTTVCYNKNVGKDGLTFSDDVNYSCPSVIDGHTNDTTNRQSQMSTIFFGEPTDAQLLNAKIIEEKIETTIGEYSACLMELDSSNKCSSQLNQMNSKCQGDLTPDCPGAQAVYNACVEEKYPSEAESICGNERLALDEAALEAEKLKEETGIDSAANLGLDSTLRVEYSYENPDCSTMLGSEFLEWFEGAYKLLQIGAIVFTVVTGILGYAGAIMSSDDDAIKKATKKFKTRLIITVILFILPVTIEFILGLVEVPGLTNTNPLCK